MKFKQDKKYNVTIHNKTPNSPCFYVMTVLRVDENRYGMFYRMKFRIRNTNEYDIDLTFTENEIHELLSGNGNIKWEITPIIEDTLSNDLFVLE